MAIADPIHTLIALALDLLAHTEAQYREARRLDGITQLLVREARDEHADARHAEQLRAQLRGLREMAQVQTTLVAEIENELSVWIGSKT